MECTAPGAADPEESSEVMETEAPDNSASGLHSGAESVESREPGDPVSEEEPVLDSDYEEELPPPRPAKRRRKRRWADDNQIAAE